jgi:hypothetical protein
MTAEDLGVYLHWVWASRTGVTAAVAGMVDSNLQAVRALRLSCCHTDKKYKYNRLKVCQYY